MAFVSETHMDIDQLRKTFFHSSATELGSVLSLQPANNCYLKYSKPYLIKESFKFL